MIACSLLIAATLAHQTAVPSVEVSDAAILHESNGFWAIEASMTNRTDQAVTTWAIHWTVRFADGTSQQGGFGMDGILLYAGVLPPRDQKILVPPRSTIRVREDYLSFPQKTDVAVLGVSAVSLSYAIFADDTWIGDQQQALDVFQRRGQHADTSGLLLPILRDAQKDGATPEAMRTALARLDTTAQPGFNPAETQVTRTNLKLFLDGKIHATGDEFLQKQIDSLAATQAAYEAHRRPKSSIAGR